jgi:hypothetical protein
MLALDSVAGVSTPQELELSRMSAALRLCFPILPSSPVEDPTRVGAAIARSAT